MSSHYFYYIDSVSFFHLTFVSALRRTSTDKGNQKRVAGRWEAQGKLIRNTSLSSAPNLRFCKSRLQRRGSRYLVRVFADWLDYFTGCVYLKGSLCEQTVKKGGTTRFRPRPFVRTGAFFVIPGAKVRCRAQRGIPYKLPLRLSPAGYSLLVSLISTCSPQRWYKR